MPFLAVDADRSNLAMGTVHDDRVVDVGLMGIEAGDLVLGPLIAFLTDVPALAVATPSDLAAR